MQLIHSNEVTLSFHTIFEDTYLFIPPWFKFKNFATVEIGILQSQTYTISNFHSLVTMESATSKTLRGSNSVSPLVRRSHLLFEWRTNRCDHHQHYRRRRVRPFSHFGTHSTVFEILHTQHVIKCYQNASIIIRYKRHNRKAINLGPTPELNHHRFVHKNEPEICNSHAGVSFDWTTFRLRQRVGVTTIFRRNKHINRGTGPTHHTVL